MDTIKNILIVLVSALLFTTSCDIGSKFKAMNKKLDYITLSIPADSLIQVLDSLNTIVKNAPDSVLKGKFLGFGQDRFGLSRIPLDSLQGIEYSSFINNETYLDSILQLFRKEDISIGNFKKDYWKHTETFIRYKQNVPESNERYWWRQLYVNKDSAHTRAYLLTNRFYVVDSIGDLLLLKPTAYRELK